jgi:hypothetical protein
MLTAAVAALNRGEMIVIDLSTVISLLQRPE